MDNSHRLKEILQLQLATDVNATLHLPFVLETLTKNDFLPSPHIQKWIARVNSLIHSKDPATKWSGLCLALQTATFSKDLMLECAQSWVGAAMPLLVNQPPPTVKASIRLLCLVFTSAMDVPEFQRQVCIPNVPKYANALVALLDKDPCSEVALLVIDTLAHIVSIHPSLCRPLHGPLSNVALRHLNGSAPSPMSRDYVEACSKLYAVLPQTGGKVNAPNLWRKSLDDTLSFAWGAFLQLRTTYPDRGYSGYARPNPSSEDPVVFVPLALDRLRAAVRVIKDLLRTNISRPVVIPIGPLVRFCSALLQCSPDERPNSHADATVHSLECSVIPTLWSHACELITCITQTGKHHLTPHASLLLTHLASHLERSPTSAQTVSLLRAVMTLVSDGSRLHDNVIASRLTRATMRYLAVILSQRSQGAGDSETKTSQAQSRKGKKRARGYEGDEVFKVGREVVCSTADDGQLLLTAVDVLESLLFRTTVNPPVQSIAARLLLAIYASLPQLPPALLSPDVSLHSRLYAKLQRVCVHLAIGTASTMSKSLGLVLSVSDGTLGENADLLVSAEAELLLHPRVPPLVRSLPHIEMLSLFRAEEGDEEIDARRRVGLGVLDDRATDQSDATGSQTTLLGEATSTSSVSHPPLETARIAGAPPIQEPSNVAMQVDIPLPAPATFASAGASQSLGLSRQLRPATEQAVVRAAVQGTLPPPPDPLPSSSAALGPRSTTAAPPPVTHVPVAPLPTDEGDDDEPMPTIDMGSDSDSE